MYVIFIPCQILFFSLVSTYLSSFFEISRYTLAFEISRYYYVSSCFIVIVDVARYPLLHTDERSERRDKYIYACISSCTV